ncbi:DJ-1/PfpI family protein [Candidatus Peregrinibacteria bacterium]|nr:DJ-1/PfpI family protein [Candidatus Peregrinibacteria bacterium]
MKTALFIIAQSGFQDTEYGVPRKILENAGFEITVASSQKGRCTGKFGLKTDAGYSLPEVSGAEYDVAVFIGGPGCEQEFHGNAEYFRIARETVSATAPSRLLAAICIAPAVLSDSGIFKGKRVTSWDDAKRSQKSRIEKNGAIHIGEDVTVDGNIITANGPEAAEKFGKMIQKMMSS